MPCDLQKRQLKEEFEHLTPWIKQVISGQITLDQSASSLIPQDGPDSYFPRISSDLHGCINWSLSMQDLESFVLAFSKPYSGSFTFIKGQKVRIIDLAIERECYMHPFTYGLILHADPESFLISCNGGIMLLKRDSLSTDANDLRIKSGDRFYTPDSVLQKALLSRVFYKPDGLVTRDYTSRQES